MARFKKKKSSGVQKINTSALPDIIFMLLFFFMVTTTMREVTLIVKVVPPEATEVQKLEKKSLVSYIYVGVPMKTQFGIGKCIVKLHPGLKADKGTRMGIITDIKQELRKSGAFKINYSSRKVLKLSN